MHYVAPARRLLDELHITDATGILARGVQPGTELRCGQFTKEEELWWPVERHVSDRVCAGCEGLPPVIEQPPLFA